MNTTIELPIELYKRLEKFATGFDQTPISVINGILDQQELSLKATAKEQDESINPSRYIFNNESLSKSRLVLKVITEYVYQQEEEINLYQLHQAFPNELQGSLGIANRFYEVMNKYDGEADKRHFVKEQDLLDLQDGKVAVCSQWTLASVEKFIQHARNLGFDIEKDTGSLTAFSVSSQCSDERIFSFNGEELSADRLVYKVIKSYVETQETDINLYQLSQAFPNKLQGFIGVANKFYDVVTQYDGKPNKYHFIDEYELLDLQDGKVAVCSEWGSHNIDGFVSKARSLGFDIQVNGVNVPNVANESSYEDTIYKFNGEALSASNLVHKVVTDYVVSQEEEINLYQLFQAFPNNLQGSVGIANKFYDVMTKYDGQPNKLHFIDEYDLLDLQDGKVAVCSDWGPSNIARFIEQARKLGYEIMVDGEATPSNDQSMHFMEEEIPCMQEAVPSVQDDIKTDTRKKYVYEGERFAASHLVLRVITDYVANQEEDINLYQLSQAFPNELQGEIGIANRYVDVLEQYSGEVNKRHFVKEKYVLDLQDGKVVVCTEWNDDNLQSFIDQARKHGFEIEVDNQSSSIAA